MNKNILASCLVLAGSVLASASAQASQYIADRAHVKCAVISTDQAAALFDRWNNALQTGDPAKVAANYAHDAVLLPTLSGKVRYTDQARLDYFKDFLKKKPVARIDSRTIRRDCNTVIDTGLYTFRFNGGTQTTARYTFTYGWNGKDWLITSHHSSVLPKDK